MMSNTEIYRRLDKAIIRLQEAVKPYQVEIEIEPLDWDLAEESDEDGKEWNQLIKDIWRKASKEHKILLSEIGAPRVHDSDNAVEICPVRLWTYNIGGTAEPKHLIPDIGYPPEINKKCFDDARVFVESNGQIGSKSWDMWRYGVFDIGFLTFQPYWWPWRHTDIGYIPNGADCPNIHYCHEHNEEENYFSIAFPGLYSIYECFARSFEEGIVMEPGRYETDDRVYYGEKLVQFFHLCQKLYPDYPAWPLLVEEFEEHLRDARSVQQEAD